MVNYCIIVQIIITHIYVCILTRIWPEMFVRNLCDFANGNISHRLYNIIIKTCIRCMMYFVYSLILTFNFPCFAATMMNSHNFLLTNIYRHTVFIVVLKIYKRYFLT